VRFLRATYATVTAFWTGFLFVFCLQVLLFLVLDLAIEVGATSKQEANWGAAMGVIFSIIPFVYGLSSALVIAGAYIQDTFRGHPLIRNFTFRKLSPVAVEWIFFTFFLGAPIFILCCSLLSGSDSWWEITSLFWFASVLAFYVIFAGNVIWYELRACWEVTRNLRDDDNDDFWHVVYRSIRSRQRAVYSGRKSVTYLSMGSIRDAEFTDSLSTRKLQVDGTMVEKIGLRSKATEWKIWSDLGFYKELDQPERFFTIDDARDVRPYLTSYTWNLEKVFCRPRDSRYIAIVKGPGAVTRAQMKASFICSLLGTFLMFFVLFSALIYLELGGAFTTLILAAGVLVCYPSFVSTFRLYRATQRLVFARSQAKDSDESDDEEKEEDGMAASKGIFLVHEQYRINVATDRLCFLMFAIEVMLMLVWPLASLYSVGNWTLASLFVIVAGISGVRYYISAAVVLEETGHLDLVDGNTDEERWQNQSRLNEIVGNITVGRSRGAWMSVLGTFGFVVLALFVGAVGTNQETTAAVAGVGNTYLPSNEFVYQQKDSLRYPTCALTSAAVDQTPLNTMADYTFLAGLAYSGDQVASEAIAQWFSEGAILQDTVVAEYRNRTGVSSAVSFKLFTFPSSADFAIVSIRGTQNNWDMLTDAQLWSSAALMQFLRELLPFGEIWTPIMDSLINIITSIESESIERVSFYKDTTRFVQFLQNQSDVYSGVAVTGHSLGGGLSIITGAIAGVPAVALSGPNAMLSRKSFDPQVSAEQLNSKTFNIIPERDVVPMIDDPAQNYQSIRCEADFADFIGCHDSTRSLCEILYTCGNDNRPIPCECHTLYNYPQPVQTAASNRTFAEACGLAEA
jgi:lipase ATG15